LPAPAPQPAAAPAAPEAPQRIVFVRPRDDPPAVPRDTTAHAPITPVVASVTPAPVVAPTASSSSSKSETTPQNHTSPTASTSKDTSSTSAAESSSTASSPSSSSSKPSTTTTTTTATSSTQYLSPKDESDFYILQSTNELFREGYLMLESDLTIHEIAEFLREWVSRAQQPDRDRRFGLGEHWRRKLDWMRNVRDPRLARLGINLNNNNEGGGAAGEQLGTNTGVVGDDGKVGVPMIMGEDGELRKDEKALMAKWLEIWDAGMGAITAKSVDDGGDDGNSVEKAGKST